MRGLLFAVVVALVAPAIQGPEGTAIVRGRVVDAITGKPIANARVALVPPWEDNRYRPPQRAALTDSAGAFEITAVTPGDYSVGAAVSGDYLGGAYGQRAAGGAPRLLAIPDKARVDITLTAWPAASIRGHVRDEQGRPIVDAQVVVVRRDGGSFESVSTDDRGHYVISKVVPGDYTVGVPIGLTSRRVKAATVPRSANEYVPPFHPYLLDRDGRAMLTIWGAPFPPPARDGRPNVYTTTYYGGAALPNATYVSMTAGQAREGVDIVLRDRPGRRVSGIASTANGPVAGIVLDLESDSGPDGYLAGSQTAHAAPDGSFVFIAVPDGSYRLRAYRRNPPFTEVSFVSAAPLIAQDDVTIGDTDVLSAMMPLTVTGDMEGIEMALRPGTPLSGRILLEDGTPPVLGPSPPRVALITPDGDGFTGRSSIKVAANGTITGRAIPGSYLLDSGGPARSLSFRSLRINGREAIDRIVEIGEAPVALELIYAQGQTLLQGQVTDERGALTRDASLVVFPTEERAWATASMSFTVSILQLRKPGFSVAGLTAGEYYVAALDETAQRFFPSASVLRSIVPLATRVRVEPGSPANVTLVMHEVPRR